jgi:hypothetical protein
MRFAIERASNKYLWELDCLYEGYDFDDYLEKTKTKPIDIDDVYLFPIDTKYGMINVWCVDIFSIDELVRLCDLTSDGIVVSKCGQYDYGIDLLLENELGILTIYDSYLD